MISERQSTIARYIVRKTTGFHLAEPRSGATNLYVYGGGDQIRFRVGKNVTVREVRCEGDAGWLGLKSYKNSRLIETAASTESVRASSL
jgi:hypothetical protein